jgi:predicted HTH transcriptional regulator
MIAYETLIDMIQKNPESEWIEYKEKNTDKEKIGENISALVNSACLQKQPVAFIIWGVQDETRNIIGTNFNPKTEKVGNEPFENWLNKLLQPRIQFEFQEFEHQNKKLVVLEIQVQSHQPLSFQGSRYIRIGSTTKNLKDFPVKEALLWKHFNSSCFEDQIALVDLNIEQVFNHIDYESYFKLLDLPIPKDENLIIEYLENDGILIKKSVTRLDITNMGAILLAKDLKNFKHLARKAVRVIIYKGNSKVETKREQEGGKGYAVGFEGLVKFINDQLPSEIMGKALRKTLRMYPELAIRELVANALIHQDFSISGTAPMIEIFESRLEITNPGQPIVDTKRLLNLPPRSRNEKMASLLRRFGICEERGSGIEKVMTKIEEFQLPAPLIESAEDHTKVVLFSSRPLNEYSKEDLNRACYFHACLKYKHHESLTNTSLRERLNLEQDSAPQISRILNDAVTAQLIKIKDETVGKKARQYVPIWA